MIDADIKALLDVTRKSLTVIEFAAMGLETDEAKDNLMQCLAYHSMSIAEISRNVGQ